MQAILTFPPYPWLQETWDRLQTLNQSGQLPHAMLFTGAEGVGKYQLAQAFAWSLLCKSPADAGTPCGQCSGCNLVAAGNHPDLTVIEPEEEGKPIKIDRIREFIEAEGITSHAAGYKPVLIRPADSMNQAAANSLLKTLEEPVSGSIMMLITANPSRLPATIRSRCRQVSFSVPPMQVASDWLRSVLPDSDPEVLLQAAAGSPLTAVRMSGKDASELRHKMLDEFLGVLRLQLDPVAVAAIWVKQDLKEILHWMCSWVIDMLRLQMATQSVALFNTDHRQLLQKTAGELDTKRLFQALSYLYDAKSDLAATLNNQMTLERLLLALVKSRKSKIG
jgi:DNA polymerase III subunit delta'